MSGVLFLLPGTALADVVAAVRADLEPELALVRAALDAPVSTRATPDDVQTGGSTATTYGGQLG